MLRKLFIITLFFSISIVFSQVENEITPPYNIKTVTFVQNEKNVLPFFRLGEQFEIQFDDLYGNEADYYYTITQYNYDWTPTSLVKAEYLSGMDNQRIMTYLNSYNTLQQYSHYKQIFPNKFNRITKSGNYILKIFNDDQELVFSRRFVIYEDQIAVSMEIRRPRNFDAINEKQNIEMVINYGDKILQNPVQNIKVTLFQNANWNSAIFNIKPQYTLGTELIYKYNTETQFWGGNEFYTLDTSNLRTSNSSVAKVSAGDIYNSHLYISYQRKNKPYTYFPDFNGNFVVQNKNVENQEIEADYSWVYFTLDAPDFFDKENIYITGMFNNYSFTDENKLVFNKESGFYEKAILIKQGYTNYQYTITDAAGKINYKNAIDGNFYLAENNYTAIIYYKGNNERYDRVIGIVNANSQGIRN